MTQAGDPAPMPERKSRSGPGLIEMGLVLATIAVAAVGVVMLLQPRPVATTLTSPTPRVSPTTAPTAAPATRIIHAFWARVGTLGPTYHLSASGTARDGSRRLGFTFDLDVVADDYAGRVHFTGKGASGKSRMVRYDGVVYVRGDGDRTWIHLKTNDPVLRQWPFLEIGQPREIAYVEAFEERGRTLHRLESTRYYRPSVPRMLGLSSFRGSVHLVRLALIVDDDGIPVRANFRLEAGWTEDGGSQVVARSTYRFTKWDSDLTITVPE